MFRILPFALAVLATCLIAAPPHAQAQDIQRVKLRALLADGYEIKSTTLVPQDAAARVANNTNEVDGVLLSLQKGPQLATCWLRLETYTAGRVLDIEWCVPHK